MSVFLALGILLIVGSNFYSGWLIQVTIAKETGRIADTLSALIAKQTAEHVALAGAQDRTSCILTMTPEDRAKFRGRYQTGAFRQECPWVSD